MKKKIFTVVALTALATANTFAQSSFTGTMDTMYSTYVRPALISLVFIVFVVTGLLKYSDFIKGGDFAKEAFFSCVKMALYPAFVLGLAEGLKALIL